MNWLYDRPEAAPHTIDVDAYDAMSNSGKEAVDRLLEDHGMDKTRVFLIEIFPGRAKIYYYELDEGDQLYLDENDEIAFSEHVVYSKNIRKAVYYDLDGTAHQSLVYKI